MKRNKEMIYTILDSVYSIFNESIFAVFHCVFVTHQFLVSLCVMLLVLSVLQPEVMVVFCHV